MKRQQAGIIPFTLTGLSRHLPAQSSPELHLDPHLMHLNVENRNLLEREAACLLRGFQVKDACLLIPRDSLTLAQHGTERLGEGETALVLSLPHILKEVPPTVLKLMGSTPAVETETHHAYRGTTLGMRPNTMWENVTCLKELGIPVPFHEEVIVKHGEIPIACQICPDLREGGRYAIHEALSLLSEPSDPRFPEFLLEPLRNQFKGLITTITSLSLSPAHSFAIDRHKISGTIQHAVEKIFFVREDKQTGNLELVVGDLDHVRIANNERSDLFLDWFEGDTDIAPQAALEISPSRLIGRQQR